VTRMRAVVQYGVGGTDVLRREDVQAPGEVVDDQLLLRIESCGVCWHDVLVRNGTYRRLVELPVIPGHELAGEVVAVGDDVRGIRVGDRVASTNRETCGQCRWCRTGHEPECLTQGFFGHNIPGGYAEYVVARENSLVVVPPSIPPEVASFLSCAVGTSMHALVAIAGTTAGDTVVVTGAGGGLGVHAVQLAKLCGASVIAVTTSSGKAAALKRYGADEVLVIERGERFVDRLRALAPDGVDVVCDNVGEPVFRCCFPTLAVDGRYVFVGQLNDRPISFNPAWLLLHETHLIGSRSSTRAELQDVIRLVDSGRVKPVLEAAMPLSSAGEAHALLEGRSQTGRVVLVP
jgi:acryloyl-coenzyme A reductase